MASILITGAGSGLGASLAKRLANDGHSVIATVRQLQPNISLEAQPYGSGTIEYRQMDVTNNEQISTIFTQLFGGKRILDVIILNAASYTYGTVETADYNASKQSFEVNYWGNVNVVRQALPYLRAQRFGKIIGIGSVSSAVALPCDGYYSAAKVATERMLESLKHEVSRFNIKVSVIAPASFKSELFKTLPSKLPNQHPYAALFNHWLENTLKSKESGTISRSDVEEKVLTIMLTPEPDFLYPVGTMATDVLATLKEMTDKERQQAILTWSDSHWWPKK